MAGHYRLEETIIEPPGSRAVASEVSVTSKAHIVPLSLTTYRAKSLRKSQEDAIERTKKRLWG